MIGDFAPIVMRTPPTRRVWAWLSLGLALAANMLRGQADGSQRWAFSTLSTSSVGTIVSSAAAGPDGTVYVGVEVGSSSSTSPSGRVFALTSAGAQKWV